MVCKFFSRIFNRYPCVAINRFCLQLASNQVYIFAVKDIRSQMGLGRVMACARVNPGTNPQAADSVSQHFGFTQHRKGALTSSIRTKLLICYSSYCCCLGCCYFLRVYLPTFFITIIISPRICASLFLLLILSKCISFVSGSAIFISLLTISYCFGCKRVSIVSNDGQKFAFH